jgi:hypothetical protein
LHVVCAGLQGVQCRIYTTAVCLREVNALHILPPLPDTMVVMVPVSLQSRVWL